ncbi:hypothetical protein B0H19DRAFT_1269613 [Mycena capillaripes]|nr:hypothetical protein B0H19DRAFT_1269613 [Mycena capillaripes]
MNPYVQIKPEDGAAPLKAEYYFPPTPPSSDSGRTTPSEWSRFSSPVQSPLPLPHVRLARSVRGTERQRAKDADPTATPHYRSSINPPSPPLPSKSRRIPRPPNAFILFRSDLLKKGQIPDTVERRQQTLSRVAGECWNLLTAAEKRVWQDLAAERAALHQLEYPDYHFKPSPRGKGKTKLRPNEGNGDELVRRLRETYVGIRGPSICASRQRKPKLQAEEMESVGDAHGSSQSSPSSFASPSNTTDLGLYDWTSSSASNSPPPSLPSPEPASNSEPALPPFFPQRTFPHFPAPRRPSTSLGFFRELDEDNSCVDGPERPASASSETGLTNLVRDFNITPTAANFGHISMPPTSNPYAMLYPSVDQTQMLRTPFSFAALNPHPMLFSDMAMETDQRSAEDSSTFSEAQFLMPLNGSYEFTDDSNFSFSDWTYTMEADQ